MENFHLDGLEEVTEDSERKRIIIERTVCSMFKALGCFPLGAEYDGQLFANYRSALRTPGCEVPEDRSRTNYQAFWEHINRRKLDSARDRHLNNASLFVPVSDQNRKIYVIKVGEGYLDLKHPTGAFEQLALANLPIFVVGPGEQVISGNAAEIPLQWLIDHAVGVIHGEAIQLAPNKAAQGKISYHLHMPASPVGDIKIQSFDYEETSSTVPHYQDAVMTMLEGLVEKIGPEVIDQMIKKLKKDPRRKVGSFLGSSKGEDPFFAPDLDDITQYLEKMVHESKGRIAYDNLPAVMSLVRQSMQEVVFSYRKDPAKDAANHLEILDEGYAEGLLAASLGRHYCGILEWLYERWDSKEKKFNRQSAKELLFRNYPA